MKKRLYTFNGYVTPESARWAFRVGVAAFDFDEAFRKMAPWASNVACDRAKEIGQSTVWHITSVERSETEVLT